MTPEQHDATVLQKLDAISSKLIETATLVETLVGNGQPGRIALIEADIKDLQAAKNRSLGLIAAASLMFETAVHWIFHK